MKNNYRITLYRNYFLLLLPLFFVIHGFTENFPLIKESDCLILLLEYLLVLFILYFLFNWVFKSEKKSAVFVFLLMFFYFFFGSIHDTTKSLFPNSFVVQYSFILPFAVILLLSLFFYFRKTNQKFNKFSQYINLLFCILIIVDLFQLTQKIIKSPKQNRSIPVGFINCDSCSKPDIFFIVSDGYAGKQELQDIFHFANLPFENALKERGFHLVDSSFSNYNYTPFSIASILSINYLKGIKGKNTSKTDRHICYSLINKNDLILFLKSQGYEFKNYSVFELNNVLPKINSPFVLTGKDLLTSQTFLSRINRDVRFNLITKLKIKSEIKRLADVQLNRLNFAYNETKEEAKNQSVNPRFVYTHLMMPHYPYLMDKNGKRTAPEMALEENKTNQKAYIEYLQYANVKFLQLIDEILKNAKKPPIIIFMSDHGFREFSGAVDTKYLFQNINAIYLPEKNYENFYNGMSNVNEFRVLLNKQFDQKLPLLKDSTCFVKE